MKYQALYRKYRPKTLDDVVGQKIVIKTLKNALINNKISHAYMFSGPRGTGKTSIAKILAKTVNCLSIKDGQVCGICKNCISCDENSTPDIIEIDAASNNGIDEIREIRNNVNLVPSELKYKVYIIDEVHMLTTGAFNALLKTLEEPPEHVIFILATTDPHKVPVTVISRCQCFEFKRISNTDMFQRIKYICDTENIKIDDEVINKITDISDGCLRDALGYLDKLSSYTDIIKLEDFYEVINIVSRETVDKFIDNLNCKNINDTLDIINNIFENGNDIMIFTQNVMEILKDDLINYYTNGSNKYPIDFDNSLIKLLNDIYIEFKESPNQKILFEVEILNFISKNKIQKNISREIKLSTDVEVEQKTSPDIVDMKMGEDDNNQNNDNDYQLLKPIYINNTFATANKDSKEIILKCWSKLQSYTLDSKFGKTAMFLMDATVRAVGKEYMIISYKYESGITDGILMLKKIQNLLFELSGLNYKLALLTESEWNKEKQVFIENRNNKIIYELMDEVNVKTHNKVDSVKKEVTIKKSKKTDAKSLFGDSVIEV